MLQVWNSLSTYEGQSKPSTWIYRVCLNTALMWRRTTQRRERPIAAGVDPVDLISAAASPADSAGHRELIEQLYGAIRTMSDTDRVLVLLSLDNIAYREIAEITGLTENHVGVALARARKRLATLMKGIIDEME